MGSIPSEVHRQNISEFRVFLATKGKNGKELLGGVAGALNDCIEKMDYGITVDEGKQFDREELEAWLEEMEHARGEKFSALQALNIKKWWGVVATTTPGAGAGIGRESAREHVDLSGLSFGFNSPNRDDEGSVHGSARGSVVNGGSQAGSAARQTGTKPLFERDDLIMQGCDDHIELLIISGMFISGEIPSREAAEVCYSKHASSWVGTPHMIAMKKAGVDSLKVLSEKKDLSYNELQTFWQDGVNSLKQIALKDGALLANEAWAEVTMSLDTTDAAAPSIAKYFWEYLTKRYKGRGFPVPVDVVLTGRFVRTANLGALNRAELAAQTKRNDELEARVTRAEQAAGQTRSELQAVKAKQSHAPTGKGPRCYNCQQFGHKSGECTNPKKERAPPAGAEEE